MFGVPFAVSNHHILNSSKGPCFGRIPEFHCRDEVVSIHDTLSLEGTASFHG